MDKLTKRALQAQVDAAVRVLCSDEIGHTSSEQPYRMWIGKIATRSSKRRVSSPLPASKHNPATYVPPSGHNLTPTKLTTRSFRRPSPTQKRTPSSRRPRPSRSAPASKPRRPRTRRVSRQRPKRRRSESSRAPTRTSGTRSLRRWAAAGRKSRASLRSGTRPCLYRWRRWASRRRHLLEWPLVWVRI